MSTPMSHDVIPAMPAVTRADTVVVRPVRPADGGADRPVRSFPGDAGPGAQEPR